MAGGAGGLGALSASVADAPAAGDRGRQSIAPRAGTVVSSRVEPPGRDGGLSRPRISLGVDSSRAPGSRCGPTDVDESAVRVARGAPRLVAGMAPGARR